MSTDGSKVVLVNTYTWGNIKEKMFDDARKIEETNGDPISFINRFNDVDFIIDDELSDDFVKVYDKETYEQILKNKENNTD